ncbi:MAG: ABC transporter substrate-binding protein [Clostridia bacterium]
MKKSLFTKVIILVLCLVLGAAVFSGCKKDPKPAPTPGYNGANTLTVGYSPFSQKFSPFFSKTAYDRDVSSMTQVPLVTSDRAGGIVLKSIAGETIPYNGTPYNYKGISDITITKNADSTVDYRFKIRDDVKFSDGEIMNIDDVIFNMYVLADPTYDGSSTFYAQPIVGMDSYRTGVASDKFAELDAAATKIIAKINALNDDGDPTTDPTTYVVAATDGFTQAQYDNFIGKYLTQAGATFAQEIVDYVYAELGSDPLLAALNNNKVAFGMSQWGFGSEYFDYKVSDSDVYVAAADGSLILYNGAYLAYDKDNPAHASLPRYNQTAVRGDKFFVENADGNYALVGDRYVNKMFAPENYAGKSYNRMKVSFEGNDAVYYTATGNTVYVTIDGKVVAVPEMKRNVYVVDATNHLYIDERNYNLFYNTVTGKSWVLDSQVLPTTADYWDSIYATYGLDFSSTGINKETAGSQIEVLAKDAFIKGEGAVGGAGAVNKITGIERINDFELNVKMSKFDAASIYQLAIEISPMHYYGDAAKYNYAENKFGFVKGDLSSVRAKTTTPMGAGAYKFVEYKQGQVVFVKNDFYFKGAPKITNIIFQETQDADKVPGVQAGTFDITDPSFTNTAVGAIKSANSNGELTGNLITTSTVDNLGYGYIGINAKAVSVGGEMNSAASKSLRKAFATLFAAYRETSVKSYYGDRASIIEYPISNTSWAAPRPSDEGYAIAYSKNAKGESIYTAEMKAEAKWAAAVVAAKTHLIAAGYVWDDVYGKFMSAPAGAKMNYEIIIPADGIGDHPSYPVVVWAAEQLGKLGITLNINDPTDPNVLWNKIEAGQQEMWAAAWQATVDPDMYQIYYSKNVVGLPGSTGGNHYNIQDPALDKLIMDARLSDDQSFRKATYKDCLDIILDWAVEVPIYQRQNAVIISSARVNVSTLTPSITTFWTWMMDIENLEMNAK